MLSEVRGHLRKEESGERRAKSKNPGGVANEVSWYGGIKGGRDTGRRRLG